MAGVNILALLALQLEGSARLPRLTEVDRSAALAVANDAANGLVPMHITGIRGFGQGTSHTLSGLGSALSDGHVRAIGPL